jgi:glycerol kinase
MQFQSDILGVPVVRPEVLETTALGAAYLAGLAVDFFDDMDEIQDQWQVDRRFTPQMADSRVKELRTNWNKALDRAKAWEEPEGAEAAEPAEAAAGT